MPNLIDKLITKVDTLRQKAADKFGLPPFDMYRVVRTYPSGIVMDESDGPPVIEETLLRPPPMIKFRGGDVLERGGRRDDRTMQATEVSLSYTENWLQGDPKAAGQEVLYKLVERNSTTAADTTYWILSAIPETVRDEVCWMLNFKRYEVCP
jgi:hypothetical protein